VQLVTPSNAVLGRSVGTGTIIQDDETTSAQILYVGDTSVVRGESGTQFAEFTVTLALSLSSSVTFQYATANGTAISGTDYSPVSGTATIQPGSSSAHIQVPILPRTSLGPTLTFTLTISNPSGAVIERSVGTGSVLNSN
jgi:chitinase